ARCPRWYRREWEESWSTPMTWKRWRALFALASNSIGGSCGVAHSGALDWKPPWTDMRWPWMRHRDEAKRGRHGWVRWYRERDRRRAPTPRVRGHLAEPAGRLRRIRRATGQARFQPSGGARCPGQLRRSARETPARRAQRWRLGGAARRPRSGRVPLLAGGVSPDAH